MPRPNSAKFVVSFDTGLNRDLGAVPCWKENDGRFFNLANARARRFGKSEAGGATFEACIWIPFLLFFFIMILDATAIFTNQSRVHRIVQDGNRQFVSGVYQHETNPQQALETWVETTLDTIAPSADATISIDGSGLLTTQVTYNASETDLSGVTGLFSSLTMRVQAIHQTES